MSIEFELASICKELKFLGDSQLAKKALCAYAAISDSEDPHVDLSYTYIMRKLRAEDDDMRKVFQKAFKEAFDKALYADLDEPQNIALMAAIKASGFKEKEDDESDSNDDIVERVRNEHSFGPGAPATSNMQSSEMTTNVFMPAHADPEFSNLSRIAGYKVYCKCKFSSLLKPGMIWYGSISEAKNNPEDKSGKLYSAIIGSNSSIQRFDTRVTRELLYNVLQHDIDVGALRGEQYMVVNPNVLESISEEGDDDDVVEVGLRSNDTGQTKAFPGSSAGVGAVDLSPDGMGGVGGYGGFGGAAILPFGQV